MIRTQMKIRRWIAGLLLICLLFSMTACSGNGNNAATSDSAAGHATGESGIVDPEDLTAEDEEQTTEETVSPAPVVETMGGFAVSSSTEESTRVGMQILSSGGNAVDAAAAISFMLSVSEPYSSGIGGGGIMLVYDSKTGKARTLDYYGCAGSSPVMTDQVAVPGVVAGMEKALELWGTMSLADVIQPSIDYAEEGFTASDMFIYRLTFSDNLRRYNPAFTNLREGDVLKQKELAETFRAIQAGGSDAFYRGEIAEKIAEKCALTTEDLANYEVKVRKVVRSEFNGWKMLGSYAPSSSLTVLQMLKVAEMLDIPDPAVDPDGYLDVLQTATTVAYKSRSARLVDPDFYKFRPKSSLSEEYLQKRIASLSNYNWMDDPERECTTQFAVIDNNGLIVCVTNSLSNTWGSYICVGGFYLNDALTNFGDEGKNAYEPGKRPRTHFSPIICVGPQGELLAIGTPGGVEIPKLIAPVLIDIIRKGTDVQTAVDRGRAFYDSDGLLCIESQDQHANIVDVNKIDKLYYYSNSHLIFGCTSVVGYDPTDGLYAVCDLRRDTSSAMVYNYEN